MPTVDSPQIIHIKDENAGLSAWLGIDSLINNKSCGGLRIIPDASAEETGSLAEVMTMKYGFLGLPHGGAKAAIW